MPRSGLDRERIVATALDLLDEVGLDGLSTRALADRLDVRSPALYWHFRSKADLVTAMADAMSLQTPDIALSSRPTRAAVAAWMTERARAFRSVLLSRRDGARVHAGSRPPEPRYGQIEDQIAALCRIGFDPLGAARATLAVSRFVVGWVLEEQSAQPQARLAPDVARFPLLARAVTAMDREPADADFDACLTAVVDGLLRAR